MKNKKITQDELIKEFTSMFIDYFLSFKRKAKSVLVEIVDESGEKHSYELTPRSK